MEINDLTVRRIYAAIGKDATKDLIDYIDSKGLSDAPLLKSPTLMSPSCFGAIQLGSSVATIGCFGAAPIRQPASANDAAIGNFTATPLTYVGVPDNALGDSGDPNENNRLACLANQINHLIVDITTIKTLVNQMRSDLVRIGLIKGAALDVADEMVETPAPAAVSP